MLMWNWELTGTIVGGIIALGKAAFWVYGKFDEQSKEIKTLNEELLKARNEIEELKIHSAKQAAVLTMTSNFLKETMTEGLDDFLKDG